MDWTLTQAPNRQQIFLSEYWALCFLEKWVPCANYPFSLNRGHGVGARLYSLYPQSTFVHLSGETVCGKALLVLEPHICCKNASPTCHRQVFRKGEALLLVWALKIFHPSCSRDPWLTTWWGSEFTCISTTVEVWGPWDCSISENNLPISFSFSWVLHSLFTSPCSSFAQLIDSCTLFAKGIIVSLSLIEALANLRPGELHLPIECLAGWRPLRWLVQWLKQLWGNELWDMSKPYLREQVRQEMKRSLCDFFHWLLGFLTVSKQPS